jgi:hypothetical protein
VFGPDGIAVNRHHRLGIEQGPLGPRCARLDVPQGTQSLYFLVGQGATGTWARADPIYQLQAGSPAA